MNNCYYAQISVKAFIRKINLTFVDNITHLGPTFSLCLQTTKPFNHQPIICQAANQTPIASIPITKVKVNAKPQHGIYYRERKGTESQ